jgi:hypothetical protein
MYYFSFFELHQKDRTANDHREWMLASRRSYTLHTRALSGMRLTLLHRNTFLSKYLLTQTLAQTIFLCVWRAIHLNVPSPNEPPYKQILRRIGWSILAVIAPEVVALNAWLQYREARRLMEYVNYKRGMPPNPGPASTLLRKLGGHLAKVFEWLCMACIALPRALDRLRMHLFHAPDLHAFKREQRQSRNASLMSQLDNNQLPWTLDTAYYAISGAAILVSGYDMVGALTPAAIQWLAKHQSRSRSLLPVQRAALQDPSTMVLLSMHRTPKPEHGDLFTRAKHLCTLH